jgi:hypothetical protein
MINNLTGRALNAFIDVLFDDVKDRLKKIADRFMENIRQAQQSGDRRQIRGLSELYAILTVVTVRNIVKGIHSPA